MSEPELTPAAKLEAIQARIQELIDAQVALAKELKVSFRVDIRPEFLYDPCRNPPWMSSTDICSEVQMEWSDE